MEIKPGVVAEIWPLEKAAAVSAQKTFDTWRGQGPPASSTTMPLQKFAIPAREAISMVRVRGQLLPPQTGGYTIHIYGGGGDDSELWLLDDASGEWQLIQRNGNPNTGAGRIKLEQGVARTFEFWSMGRKAVEVQWESIKWETKELRKVIVAKQVIPISSMTPLASKRGFSCGDGMRDEWKQKWALPLNSSEGVGSPWNDSDLDNMPSWLEQLVGTNPRKADSENRDGIIRHEIWRNRPGKYVFDLTRSRNFPQQPDEIRYLRRLEIPVGDGNDYGSRIRGLIKAPASGEYTFMLIANDTAELWIGESDSWQSKKLVAKVDQAGGQAKWTRRSEGVEKPLFPEQVVKLSLQEGKRYYIEILHKQDGKESFCSLGWIKPGAQTPEIVGPDALTSWAPDSADLLDSGLPNAWMESVGLMAEGVDPALRNAYADADNDGRSNWDEFKAESDPLKPEIVETTNRLTSEVWTGRPGDRIQNLVHDKDFPAKPSHASLVDNMDFSAEGDNYGVRLRGYLTAPDDGTYVFNISGKDACVLFLARSEDKFTKRAIANTTRGTGWRSYAQNLSQQSEPIELKKGQRYYIEALYKRGAGSDPAANPADHASVAWARPGRHGLGGKVIGAEYFSPYKKDPRDDDDDDLLNSFELAHGLDPTDPSGVNGAWNDGDADFMDNFGEQQAGLDPQVADVHGRPGLALWSCWENIVGDLSALRASPAFPLTPTRREWVTSLEGPQGLGNFYGSRLRAFVIPPATGDYTFAIAGDNQCELMLSPSELKYYKEKIAFVDRWTGFREWNTEPGQRSKPIHLEAGKRYFIEALHKQDTRGDHVSVGWKVPGAKEFEIIRGDALAAFASDPNDADDDDLPDDFEKANGITGEGRHGDQDMDGDGLTNRREFLLGTRANMADTDGDGVNDSDEINIYHTNPLVKDTPAPVLEKAVSLAQWCGTPGSWMVGANGTLGSMARRGIASWEIEISAPGVYLVEVVASARGTTGYIPPVPVTVLIDDLETTRGLILAGERPTRLVALTRVLSAGKHRVTLDNRNVRSGVGLAITSVSLYRHEGADSNTNGVPDWLENLCRLSDSVSQDQSESAVSPACIEGEARFAGDVALSVGGVEVVACEGLRGKWFANVPLDPAAAVELKAAFEGGTITESLAIKWTSTNLMTCPEVLRLRVGDSVLLTAYPEDADSQTVTFNISDQAGFNCTGPAMQPQQVRFEHPGRAVLAVSTNTPQGDKKTRSVTVEIRAADFGEEFSVAVGYERTWELPLVSRDLFIEADPWLTLGEQASTPPTPRSFSANIAEAGTARVLARLDDHGPVLAATTVNGFNFASATATGESTVIAVLADGTRVVQIGYVIDGRVPANLSIWLRLYVTDAVFANGDTWYHLTAADFDLNGMARLRILKAPGQGIPFVCHWISPFGIKDGNAADPPNLTATSATDLETPVSPMLVPMTGTNQQPSGGDQ